MPLFLMNLAKSFCQQQLCMIVGVHIVSDKYAPHNDEGKVKGHVIEIAGRLIIPFNL